MNTGKNILLIILTLLVAGGLVVGGFFLGRELSDKSVEVEKESNENEGVKEDKEEFSFEKFAGKYEIEYTQDGVEYEIFYDFSPDGLFYEEVSINGIPSATIGNYIVENSKLTTTTYFLFQGGVGTYIEKEPSYEMFTINEDGTLTNIDYYKTERIYTKTSNEYEKNKFSRLYDAAADETIGIEAISR